MASFPHQSMTLSKLVMATFLKIGMIPSDVGFESEGSDDRFGFYCSLILNYDANKCILFIIQIGQRGIRSTT